MRYHIGCTGWRNVPWKNEFYPPELDPKDYLAYYASVFDFVELNFSNTAIGFNNQNYENDRLLRKESATRETNKNNIINNQYAAATYSILTRIARKWSSCTPYDFHFSIRIPRTMLFDNNNNNSKDSKITLGCTDSSLLPPRTDNNNSYLGKFLESLAPIEEKVLAVTMDVPPFLTLARGREWLEATLNTCTYHGYSAAFQFHHTSWFQDLTYNILKRHGGSIIWPYNNIDQPSPYIINISDFLYFRWTNNQAYLNRIDTRNTPNNSSNDNDNGNIIDRPEDTKKYRFSRFIENVKLKLQEERSIESMIIVADNPIQANAILDLLDLPRKTPNMASISAATIDTPHHIFREEIEEPRRSNSLDVNAIAANQKRKIVCVDLNAFYPSCEELRNSSLKGMPHAVIMTDQREGNITKGVVSSCSYEARKYGVKSAMALSRARSLCPHLILLPVDIPYYSKVSEQVMSVLEPFADILEQASIDEAFLDCTNKIKIVDEAISDHEELQVLEQYGMSIKKAIKEKCGGLLCSVGIAPTKSAAKMASDYKKPDGLTVVSSVQIKEFLEPLEVNRVSGIGPKTEQALKELGIITLGQLAKTDVQKLKERFGKNGYWMWRVANGIDDDPVSPRGNHVSISTESTLELFTNDKKEIRSLLHMLVGEIYQKAARYGYSFRTVGIKLVRTDFSIESRETTFAESQYNENSITSSIDPLLEKFDISDNNKQQPAIRKVGLKLSHLSRRERETDGDRLKVKAGNATTLQKSLLDYL